MSRLASNMPLRASTLSGWSRRLYLAFVLRNPGSEGQAGVDIAGKWHPLSSVGTGRKRSLDRTEWSERAGNGRTIRLCLSSGTYLPSPMATAGQKAVKAEELGRLVAGQPL